jgi:hypothetical protein
VDKSGWGKKQGQGHSQTGEQKGRDKSGQGKKLKHGRHSRPGECRDNDMEGHGRKQTERALTNWRAQAESRVRIGKEAERARDTLTHCRVQRGTSQEKKTKRTRGTHRLESVEERTSQDRESNERGKGTHVLKSAERGMSQDMERDQASKGHSLSGQCRQRDNSRQGK